MNSTALGARKIIFISEAHEKFYYEKLELVRHKDVYQKDIKMFIAAWLAEPETIQIPISNRMDK